MPELVLESVGAENDGEGGIVGGVVGQETHEGGDREAEVGCARDLKAGVVVDETGDLMAVLFPEMFFGEEAGGVAAGAVEDDVGRPVGLGLDVVHAGRRAACRGLNGGIGNAGRECGEAGQRLNERRGIAGGEVGERISEGPAVAGRTNHGFNDGAVKLQPCGEGGFGAQQHGAGCA